MVEETYLSFLQEDGQGRDEQALAMRFATPLRSHVALVLKNPVKTKLESLSTAVLYKLVLALALYTFYDAEEALHGPSDNRHK